MLRDLLCIPLALHTLADAQVRLRLRNKSKCFAICFVFRSPCTLWLTPKLGCGSGIKANASRFALYSARLALTLHGFSGDTAKFSFFRKKTKQHTT